MFFWTPNHDDKNFWQTLAMQKARRTNLQKCLFLQLLTFMKSFCFLYARLARRHPIDSWSSAKTKDIYYYTYNMRRQNEKTTAAAAAATTTFT